MPQRRQRPEQQIQRALVQHLAARGARDLYWYAIPNGGWRSRAEASIMQGQGVRAGVPDLAFVHDGKPYFLELKAPAGRPTEAQLEARDLINAAGGFVAMAYDLDEAIRVLETWGLLRGTKS